MHSHLSPNISLVTLFSMQNNNKILFLFIRAASTWKCSTVIECTLAVKFEVAAPEKKKKGFFCVIIAYWEIRHMKNSLMGNINVAQLFWLFAQSYSAVNMKDFSRRQVNNRMFMIQCHVEKWCGDCCHALSAQGWLICVSKHWDNKSSNILANNLLFLHRRIIAQQSFWHLHFIDLCKLRVFPSFTNQVASKYLCVRDDSLNNLCLAEWDISLKKKHLSSRLNTNLNVHSVGNVDI